MTETDHERPLVTFALFAYKQEQFIREAVEGAFAQTYSPLEIILSDDCSPDRTFEIMKEMAAEYKGPHKIILNRNEKNLGIGGHLNQVMSLCRGKLVIAAAGDDISLENRSERLVSKWLEEPEKTMSLYSAATKIDAEGKQFGTESRRYCGNLSEITQFSQGSYVMGCAHAWVPKLFRMFEPLRADLVNEDYSIPARALILGGQVEQINDELLLYRDCTSEWRCTGATNHIADVRYRVGELRLRCLEQLKADIDWALEQGFQCSRVDEGLVLAVGNAINEMRQFISMIDSGMVRSVWRRLTNNNPATSRAFRRYCKNMLRNRRNSRFMP